MRKAIAMLAVFSYCTWIGLSNEARLRQRGKCIRMFERFVRQLMISIDYGRLPLADLIRRCAGGEELLLAMSSRIERGASALEAFQSVMELPKARGIRRVLEQSDRLILENFFSTLGKTDVFAQREGGAMILNELSRAAADAEEAYSARGRMSRTLGMLAGAAVAILMI